MPREWDCNDPAWGQPETEEEWEQYWAERVRAEAAEQDEQRDTAEHRREAETPYYVP